MITLYHYKIPFRSPFRTSKGVYRERQGIILDAGHSIRSEIAPLPGFSGESLDDVFDFLRSHGSLIQYHYNQGSLNDFLSDGSIRKTMADLPSVRFGLSMLDEQQKAVASGLPLFKWWIRQFSPAGTSRSEYEKSDSYGNGNTIPERPDEWTENTTSNYPDEKDLLPPVRSNAIVGLHEIEKIHRIIAKHKKSGYSTIKLKLPPDWKQACSLILSVCTKNPDLLFRFDANGAFSKTDAHQLLHKLKSEGVSSNKVDNFDYLEEPLHQQDMEALAELRSYRIRIAVDESVRTASDLDSMLSFHSADVLVLKPMLFGTMSDMAPVWSVAGNRISVTLSSTMETITGRTLLTHLAVFINTMCPTDHGLATGDLLESDLPPAELSKYTSGPDTREDVGISIKPISLEKLTGSS